MPNNAAQCTFLKKDKDCLCMSVCVGEKRVVGGGRYFFVFSLSLSIYIYIYIYTHRSLHGLGVGDKLGKCVLVIFGRAFSPSQPLFKLSLLVGNG